MNIKVKLGFGVLLCVLSSMVISDSAIERAMDTAELSGSINVSQYLDYIEQKQQFYTIEDLVADQNSHDIQWNENTSKTPAFGFDTNTFWFRLVVYNSAKESINRLLEIKNPVLDEVLFYQVGEDGRIFNVSQTGDNNPTNERPFFHHNLILPFKISAGDTHYLYFRVTTAGSLEFPLSMWSPEAFQVRDQINLLVFGGLFGVLIAMGLYNFFVYTLFHDRSLFYYAAYSLSLMLFLSSIHGFSAQYFWPENSWLREYALVILIPASLIFAILFSTTFLQLERSYPRVYRCSIGLVWACILLVFLSPFFGYSFLIRISAALVIPVCIAGVILGVLRWWQGYKPARYFIIAWTAFLLAIAAFALSKFGLFVRSGFADYAVQIGALIEAILFSFALADRMNTQRQAFQVAQREALQLQKVANERLESSVSERTVELRRAMGELEKANLKLQALTMQDGLTGIRNRRYFDEKMQQEWQRCARNSESLGLLLIDIDFFKNFNDQYGHLAGDECLKKVANLIQSTLVRPSDSVARYGGEEFVVILPETHIKGAIHVAENIRQAIAKASITVDGKDVNVSVSIGAAALTPKESEGPDLLIGVTDQALYRAKSEGRNCTRSPDKSMDISCNRAQTID